MSASVARSAQGCWNPAACKICCTSRRHDVVHERLASGRVLPGLDHDDRVGVDRAGCLGEVDPEHLGARRLHVGLVDDAGVDLAELDLGQDRRDVLFERDRVRRQLGRGECLRGCSATGHRGRAQRQFHSGLRDVGEARDVVGIAWRDGDLELVLGEHLRCADAVTRLRHRGHRRRARGGEHVDRRALGDLCGERVGATVGRHDLHARVRLFEVGGQCREGRLQRRCGEHHDSCRRYWASPPSWQTPLRGRRRADETNAASVPMSRPRCDDAAFFDELQPARPSATTTAVTTTADAWRFIDSPRSGRDAG